MQLPTPHELLALIAETSPKQASFNEQDRIRFGREFSDAWPAQQVQREDDAAHFTPSITGSTGLMGLAYALYYFLLPGFDDLPLLTFQWQAPPPQGCFWVGLADFDTNCWRWFDCRDLDSMNIFWMSRHLDPDGSFLMVLAATGTTPSTLQWLRVGGNAPPLAKLTLLPQGDSAPLIVGFDASASVDLDGVITHYSWDFDGDGLYDEHTLDTPSTIHTYEEPGVYQPLVMVQDAHVACSTTSAELTVGGPPVAVLDADPLDGYAPLEVSFDAAESAALAANIALFEWDWEGDGAYQENTGTTPTATHTFEDYGEHEVVVRVTDDRDRSSTASVLVNVRVHPVARLSIEPTGGNAPQYVELDATDSYHAGGVPLLCCEWDYDGNGTYDETTETLLVIHTYLIGGEYEPKVRVTYEDEESAEASASLDISGFCRSWGGTEDDMFHAGSVDPQGNVYAGGATTGFGLYPSDCLLVKYTPAGEFEWAQSWGGGDIDCLMDVICDDSGGIYAGGYTYSYAPGGEDDMVVLKYDSAGTLLWCRTWGRDLYDWVLDMAVDGDGNLVVAGLTRNTVYTSDRDFVLVKYDPSGTLLWDRTYNSGRTDRYPFVSCDSGGDIYVTGRNNYGGGGGIDAALLKVSAAGELLWQKYWGGIDQDAFYRLEFDSEGNLYTVGFTMSFTSGEEDCLLAKYTPAGELVWARSWGTEDGEVLQGLYLDGSGNVYAGGLVLLGTNEYRGVLLKYTTDGARLWGKMLNTSGNTKFWDVFDLDGVMCLAGSTGSAYGSWYEMSGSERIPGASTGDLEGVWELPAAVTGAPAGTSQFLDEAVIDEGGGALDALLVAYDYD